MGVNRHILLVASGARDCEALLRDLGRPFSVQPPAALATLMQSPAPPDVLIADVRTQPQLLADLAALRRRHPSTGIVILARLDPTLMLEAMRAGITECVTEPIDAGQLDAALRRLAPAAAPRARGEMYAFIGAKGGVGTTTLAVNVASVLAKTGERVLFADLHVAYGDAGVYLGAEPRFSLLDALENTHRLDEAFFKGLITPTACRVDLLASAERDAGAPVDLRGLPSVLEMALSQYRYVVADVPRAGRAVVDPLERADAIVIVTSHELAAVRSASHLAAGLRERYGSARVSTVVSRFDRGSDLKADDIERAIGARVRQTFPSDYRAAIGALNAGKPLVLQNHTRLASTLKAFTRGLAGLDSPEDEPVKAGGVLGLFGPRFVRP